MKHRVMGVRIHDWKIARLEAERKLERTKMIARSTTPAVPATQIVCTTFIIALLLVIGGYWLAAQNPAIIVIKMEMDNNTVKAAEYTRYAYTPQAYESYQTYEKCCNGGVCSDVYYDSERDVCVLTLCKSMGGLGGNCEYKPGELE